MAAWTTVTISLDSTEPSHLVSSPVYDFVSVYLDGGIHLVLHDAQVAEDLARLLWEAADEIRAKNDPGVQAEIAKGLALDVGGAA